MSELRLVLLGVGLVVIAAVIGWEIHRRRAGQRVSALALAGRVVRQLQGRLAARRRRRRAPRAPELGALEVPELGAAEPDRGDELEVGDLGALASAVSTVPGRGPRNGGAGPAKTSGAAMADVPDDERLLMVITLMAPGGTRFTGERLRAALETFDLEHGRMGLFHHYGGRRGAHATPVFSVANAVEPGTFRLEEMARLTTPGLSLFMQLPGPLDGPVAFDLMLDVAARLARELGGELRDGRRSTLTAQGVRQMREQVIEHATLRARRGPTAGADRVLH